MQRARSGAWRVGGGQTEGAGWAARAASRETDRVPHQGDAGRHVDAGLGAGASLQASLGEGTTPWCLLGQQVIGTAAGLREGVRRAGFGG